MDIFYNLLHLIGDPFRIMDPTTALRTSGLVIEQTAKGESWIATYDGQRLGLKGDDDEDLPMNARLFKENMKNSFTLRWSKNRFTEKDYQEAKLEGSLFGMDFLPWSNKLILTGEGDYRFITSFNARTKTDWRTAALAPNEWAGQNLNYKIQTITILGVSFLVLWHGVPLIFSYF